jgi:hypothetical protein
MGKLSTALLPSVFLPVRQINHVVENVVVRVLISTPTTTPFTLARAGSPETITRALTSAGLMHLQKQELAPISTAPSNHRTFCVCQQQMAQALYVLRARVLLRPKNIRSSLLRGAQPLLAATQHHSSHWVVVARPTASVLPGNFVAGPPVQLRARRPRPEREGSGTLSQLRPFFLPLFTGVRRRGILGS